MKACESSVLAQQAVSFHPVVRFFSAVAGLLASHPNFRGTLPSQWCPREAGDSFFYPPKKDDSRILSVPGHRRVGPEKVLNLLDNFDNLTFTFKCQGNLRVYGARAYAVSMLQGFKALESLRNAWAWPSSSSRSASGQISAAWKKCEGSQEIRKETRESEPRNPGICV